MSILLIISYISSAYFVLGNGVHIFSCCRIGMGLGRHLHNFFLLLLDSFCDIIGANSLGSKFILKLYLKMFDEECMK